MEMLRYNTAARILHWGVGLLVLVQIALGFVTDAAPRGQADDLRAVHAGMGVLVLALMAVRLGWRLAVSPPPLPATLPDWQRRAAGAVHGLLYLLLFAMPISGLMVWMWIGEPIILFGLVPLPLPQMAGDDEFWLSAAGYAHEYGALTICGLVTIHVAAAAWHAFVLKDRLVRDRML